MRLAIAQTQRPRASSWSAGKRIAAALLSLLGAALATSAHADWHYGTVNELSIGYDGSTVTVKVTGLQRSNCTCYASWPDQACLDRTRASFLEEYALLLSARRTGQAVGINIDETTCKILAIYEVDN